MLWYTASQLLPLPARHLGTQVIQQPSSMQDMQQTEQGILPATAQEGRARFRAVKNGMLLNLARALPRA